MRVTIYNEKKKNKIDEYYLYEKKDLTFNPNIEEYTLSDINLNKNFFPTVKFDKNCEGVVLDEKVMPRLRWLSKEEYVKYKDLFNDELLEQCINANGDGTYIITDTRTKTKLHNSLLNKFPYIAACPIENKIIISKSKDLKYYFFYDTLKFYINKGKTVINDDNYKGIERMLMSGDNNKIQFAFKLLEKVDVGESLIYMSYLYNKAVKHLIKTKDLIYIYEISGIYNRDFLSFVNQWCLEPKLCRRLSLEL